MTTATLPGRIIRPIASAPARRSFLTGFLAMLVVGLLAIVGASVAIGVMASDRVLGGVSVAGVDVAGLDRQSAAERLEAALPSVSDGQAVISADGTEQTIPFADLGRAYDFDAMLDAAFAVGRDRDPIADGLNRLRSLVHETSLPVAVRAYDEAALDRAAAGVAGSISRHPVQAYVDRETFAVHESSAGRVLDAATVRASLAAALDTTSPADVRIELSTTEVPAIVDTAEAQAAASAASATAEDLSLTIDGAPEDEAARSISGEQIASWIRFGPTEGSDYGMILDEESVGAAVAAFADDVNQAPIDASFAVAGAGLGGVIAGQDGRALDAEASTEAVLAALGDRGAGTPVSKVALAVDVTEPALTTAEAEEIRPRMQLVSSWTTNYVPGDGNGFGANISIGAWDLDGYNIAPGAWFSFWGGIGPVTVERGYQYGGAIINGRSVAQGALAGGICSTSTTLFNAAMRFGLEIGERENHFYYIDRYPTGLDATVAIVDSSVTDMTFRNDTEYPIVIRGFGTPGQVTFQLWSVPTGRTVALSDPVITERRAAIETTQVDTSLAPGTRKRVEYPHDGFNVTVSRTVYGPDGGVLHQNTWFSDYRAVNGITLVGPASAAAPAGDDGATAAAPPDDEG